MYGLNYTGKFKKDLKTCQKRKYNIKLLQNVIDVLRIPEQLEEKHKDHSLTGNYAGFRECHVLPDWLLIYRYNGDCLELARTGTHSDLFK
ncbi:MAG: type II toxin-antitoxin system YafQ family toxin [Lachnospiraceae bacterium]